MQKKTHDACLYINDRKVLFIKTREHKDILYRQLKSAFEEVPEFAESLGLEPTRDFKVHALRRAMRVRLNGRSASQVFVALTQSENVEGIPGLPNHKLRGGSTIVVDLSKPSVPS